MTGRYAGHRRLVEQAAGKLADAHNQPWRPFRKLRNRKRRREALILLAAARAERERIERLR